MCVTPKQSMCPAAACAGSSHPACARRQNSSHGPWQRLSALFGAALLLDGDGSQVAISMQARLLQEVLQDGDLRFGISSSSLDLERLFDSWQHWEPKAFPGPGPALILPEAAWEGAEGPPWPPGPAVTTVWLSSHGVYWSQRQPLTGGGGGGEAEGVHILRLPKMGRFMCSGEARKALSLGRALRRAT